MPEPLLTFVQLSDTHISADPDYGRHESPHSTQEGAKALVKQVNALPFKIDFVLHTGDVVYDPEPEPYETAKEILGQLKYPIKYVRGNHDHPDYLQRIMLGRSDTTPYVHYEFEVNGVQFIVLDSNGPAEPPRGYVTADQLAWLDDLLSKDDSRPLVVTIHHNTIPTGSPWLDDFMRITNGEDVHNILKKRKDRLRGVFFGHVHQNISMYRDGILYTSALSSWGQFHAAPEQIETIHDEGAECGFNVVHLTADGGTYIRRYRFRVE